jgi:hypothetical protein
MKFLFSHDGVWEWEGEKGFLTRHVCAQNPPCEQSVKPATVVVGSGQCTSAGELMGWIASGPALPATAAFVVGGDMYYW